MCVFAHSLFLVFGEFLWVILVAVPEQIPGGFVWVGVSIFGFWRDFVGNFSGSAGADTRRFCVCWGLHFLFLASFCG